MSPEKYVNDILARFILSECNNVSTPMCTNQKFSLNDGEEKIDFKLYRSLIGSLPHLTNSKPNILQATSLLSKFMQGPSRHHLGATTRILRYLKCTSSFGMWYTNINNFRLYGYSESNWGGCVDDRNSTTSYVFFMDNGAMSWISKKQSSMVLLSSEAKYMVVIASAYQAIWLRRILDDMNQSQVEVTTIYCDNQSKIAMIKNLVYHSRTRHIKTHHHFIPRETSRWNIAMQVSKLPMYSLSHFH